MSAAPDPLLAARPGRVWLALFFVVPMYFMGELALRSGIVHQGFTFDWAWSNYSDALSGNTEQLFRSFVYAAPRP